MVPRSLLCLSFVLATAPALAAGNLVINETEDKIIVEYTGDGASAPAEAAKSAPSTSPGDNVAVPAQKREPVPAAEMRGAARRVRHQRERTDDD